MRVGPYVVVHVSYALAINTIPLASRWAGLDVYLPVFLTGTYPLAAGYAVESCASFLKYQGSRSHYRYLP